MNASIRLILALMNLIPSGVALLRCALLVCAVEATFAVTVRAEGKSGERPDQAYLFSYFYHQTAGDGLHLAWSRDGFAWEILGGDKSYLHPTVGENKLMRDPCLYRGPDGVFRLVWTTSWSGKTIGYASSKD
jgi:hypothetical protein